MSLTKKLLSGAALVFFLSGTAAYAGDLNIDLSLGQPAPVVEAPAPQIIVAPSPAYVVAPYNEHYDPHHRRHDWRYWHDHRDHDHNHDHDHDRDHDHWDHDHR